ncbi:diguanylate cyclase (GGDEF)-like protein [Agitococcus lubricus]|uniref:diguanylate cyclase n=2 Tax=Agitococcus lubricus TaxID=1077255 RepID=A0A2T5J4E9_9GAMM|nr:diguanylate cyclase (GGDEF)-like protein [Agitococcus lubricus]
MTHASGTMATPPFYSRILDFLLSTNSKQRLRIRRSLLAGLVFVVSVGITLYFSSVGGMNPQQAHWLNIGMLCSCLGFYIALRTGINLRFKEPALTLPQVLVALTWISLSYTVTGQAHSSILSLYALVMVFCIFTMSARSSVISAAYGVLTLAIAMLYKVNTDPDNYPFALELVNFILALTIMPTIGSLAAQISEMRDKLKAQKYELEQALEHIKKIAAHDELTGLINRRRMSEVLAEYVQNQEREPTGFSIAMIDLDYFKKINDQYGHLVGDEVLHGFAEIAKNTLRKADLLSRWGGEEFLLLMPETNAGQPSIGLDRLRKLLQEYPISQHQPALRVSFSAGISSYRQHETIHETIKRADEALYQAKANGRDCTVNR